MKHIGSIMDKTNDVFYFMVHQGWLFKRIAENIGSPHVLKYEFPELTNLIAVTCEANNPYKDNNCIYKEKINE